MVLIDSSFFLFLATKYPLMLSGSLSARSFRLQDVPSIKLRHCQLAGVFQLASPLYGWH